jgi:hypothetical protein
LVGVGIPVAVTADSSAGEDPDTLFDEDEDTSGFDEDEGASEFEEDDDDEGGWDADGEDDGALDGADKLLAVEVLGGARPSLAEQAAPTGLAAGGRGSSAAGTEGGADVRGGDGDGEGVAAEARAESIPSEVGGADEAAAAASAAAEVVSPVLSPILLTMRGFVLLGDSSSFLAFPVRCTPFSPAMHNASHIPLLLLLLRRAQVHFR